MIGRQLRQSDFDHPATIARRLWHNPDDAPQDGTPFEALLKDNFGEFPFGPCVFVDGVLHAYNPKTGAKTKIADGITLTGWKVYRP